MCPQDTKKPCLIFSLDWTNRFQQTCSILKFSCLSSLPQIIYNIQNIKQNLTSFSTIVYFQRAIQFSSPAQNLRFIAKLSLRLSLWIYSFLSPMQNISQPAKLHFSPGASSLNTTTNSKRRRPLCPCIIPLPAISLGPLKILDQHYF